MTAIAALALRLAAAAFAGQIAPTPAVAQNFPPVNIYRAGGFEITDNFPSMNLGSTATLRVMLPEEYDNSTASYQAAYITDYAAEPAAQWEAQLRQLAVSAGRPVIAVFADKFVPADKNDAAAYANFMAAELVPYIDTNYRTLRGPENRAALGALGLRLAAAKFGTFSMATAWDPAPAEIAGLPTDVKLWVYKPFTNPQAAAEIYASLRQTGHSPGGNFVINFSSAVPPLSQPLAWFFGPAQKKPAPGEPTPPAPKPELKVFPAKIKTGHAGAVFFWGRAELPNGVISDYLPDMPRSSPPYLGWQDGFFILRSGAEGGTVRLSGFFMGGELTASVEVEAPPAPKPQPAQPAAAPAKPAAKARPGKTAKSAAGAVKQPGAAKKPAQAKQKAAQPAKQPGKPQQKAKQPQKN